MNFEIGEVVKIIPTGRPGTIVAIKDGAFPFAVDDGIGSFPIHLSKNEILKIEVYE